MVPTTAAVVERMRIVSFTGQMDGTPKPRGERRRGADGEAVSASSRTHRQVSRQPVIVRAETAARPPL
jgi:hypothetical protein